MATARPIPDVAPVTSALEAWVSGSIRAALMSPFLPFEWICLADDFAFGASSSLYIATHPEQTVFRLDAAGNRTTVAGPEQGAVGTTACAFGRAPGDENALSVTTDGGLVAPYEGAVQEAKLLRLEVGEVGWPLIEQA